MGKADIFNTELGTLFKNVKKINERKLWIKAINKDTKEFIIYLIQYEQLYTSKNPTSNKGIDEDGNVIGYYSELSEKYNEKKKHNTPFTLFDTGEFFDSFVVNVYPDHFIIDANDKKQRTIEVQGEMVTIITELFEKYGEGIIGLTDSSKLQLQESLKDIYILNIRQLLNV